MSGSDEWMDHALEKFRLIGDGNPLFENLDAYKSALSEISAFHPPRGLAGIDTYGRPMIRWAHLEGKYLDVIFTSPDEEPKYRFGDDFISKAAFEVRLEAIAVHRGEIKRDWPMLTGDY